MTGSQELHESGQSPWLDRVSVRAMIHTMRHVVEFGLPALICLGAYEIFSDDAQRMLEGAGAARIVTTWTVSHPSDDIKVVDPIVPPLRELASDDREATRER